jgi:hypothetical protein
MISYFLSAPGSSGSVVLYDFLSIWIVHICIPFRNCISYIWIWIQHFNPGFPNSDSKAPNFTFCKNIVKSSLWFLYIIFQKNNFRLFERPLNENSSRTGEKKTLSECFSKLACILRTWIWNRFHISQKRGSWSRKVDKYRSVRIPIQKLG